VADEARAGLGALDALLAEAPPPAAVLRHLGPGSELLGAPAPAPVQALATRARADALVDAGLALEARQTGGAVALAPRVLSAAVDAATAAASPRAPEAAAALGRARLREALVAAEAAVRQARDAEAEGMLARLRGGLDEALKAFPEAERDELRGRVALATAEVEDRQGVRRYEEAVAALAARVPTNALGTLFPEANALAPPTLHGGHPDAEALRVRLEAAGQRHKRVLSAAKDFEGMVLVDPDRRPLVFIDRTEVTNDAFAVFVQSGAYGRADLWAPEAQPLLERFKDQTRKPGPDPWRDGRPPEGKGRLPVAGVCFYEADAYARWTKKRLPTREEWRLAAVGPSPRKYPWGDEWRDGGGCVREGDVRPTEPRPAGSFPDAAGPTGALDMIGNVRELVTDGKDVFAVGGSFRLRSQDATAQSQLKVYPLTLRPDDIGFRCARTLEWSDN
jgi:hypothetical protein